jgi:nudix-type nucleoside diphosphatase (YffH/AdpP family)
MAAGLIRTTGPATVVRACSCQQRLRAEISCVDISNGRERAMKKRVVIERRRLILDDFFKVEEVFLAYEKFDGSMSQIVRRLNFERGDSVAAVLFNKKRGTVLLVNQFKFPSFPKGPGWITELMAGMIDKGESPEEAVRREIEEETGHSVDRLTHISTFYVSPGGSSERIVLYYAEIDETSIVKAGGGLVEENEDIKVLEIPCAEAFRQIDDGEIADAKTIIGLMWLREKLRQTGALR